MQAFVFLSPLFSTAAAPGLRGEPVGRELLGALVAVAFGLYLLNRRRA